MVDQNKMEEYRRQVESRIAEEQVDEPPAAPGTRQADELDIAFLRKCYLANEVGDSILYNTLHRGRHVYNVIAQEWMTYVGPHWEVDHHGRAVADVENVALQYLRLLAEIEEELEKIGDDKEKIGLRKALQADKKSLIGRLDRLRSAAGRVQVLKCAVTNGDPLTVHPNDLDQSAWLLPVLNGVVNLKTGELRPGRPADYLTKVAPVIWKGLDEPAPVFENYLLTSLDGRQEVVDFLLRSLGCAIAGTNRERFFVVLHGKHGQNGKGRLMDIVYHILGQLAGPIQTEMLMAQKFAKGADGPTPAVMSLKGLRVAWASETEENNSFAAGKLKLYSGGDPLKGRNPNDKHYTEFIPSHIIFLLSNSLPSAPANDTPFWERIKVIEWPLSFVVRPPLIGPDGKEEPPKLKDYERIADQDLLLKLKAEASGVLAAIVRGCIDWQRQGLNPPRKVIEDSKMYRRKQDDIQEFIEQCCHVDPKSPDCKSTAKILYTKYRDWWESVETTRPLGMKKFGELMSDKFQKTKSSSIVYLGVMVDVTKDYPRGES